MRMLTSEARIDAHRFRSGYLEREGLRPAVARARHARRGARLHRRHGVDRRARDARQGAAAEGRARPPPAHRRLHPADAGARPVREPAAGARVDLALAEGARQGAERADRRAVAAVARAGDALRSPAAALRPARVRRPRAGRRRRHVHLPRGSVPRRDGSRTRKRRASPRSSSASSATARPAPCKLAFIKEHTRFENLAHGRGVIARLDAMIRADRRARRSRRPSRPTSAPFDAFLAAEPAPHARPAIIAVVKANAYGHGARAVALALEQAGAAMLACADIEEGDRPARRPACARRSSSSAR